MEICLSITLAYIRISNPCLKTKIAETFWPCLLKKEKEEELNEAFLARTESNEDLSSQ